MPRKNSPSVPSIVGLTPKQRDLLAAIVEDGLSLSRTEPADRAGCDRKTVWQAFQSEDFCDAYNKVCLFLSKGRVGEVIDASIRAAEGSSFADRQMLPQIVGMYKPLARPSNFSGAHEAYVLVVIDEATGIKASRWEAIEGLLSNEHAHWVAIGNPTDPPSAFCVRVQKPPKGAKITHISAFDTPDFTRAGITQADIANGTWEEKLKQGGGLVNDKLVTPRWAANVYEKYGPDSPMWASRVAGQVPQSSTDTRISLSWALAAVERWKARTELMRQGIETSQGGEKVIGVAVARYGDDLTVRTNTAGRVLADLADWGGATLRVDVGMGTGVIDRLREQHQIADGPSPGAKRRQGGEGEVVRALRGAEGPGAPPVHQGAVVALGVREPRRGREELVGCLHLRQAAARVRQIAAEYYRRAGRVVLV